MMTNKDFGKINKVNEVTFAPVEVKVNGHLVISPSADSYLAADDGPWLPVIDLRPDEKVGVRYVPTGWEEHDGKIWRTYAEQPIPAPVAHYIVEEIIYGLIEAGALQQVKVLVGDYWELFTMREEVSADNEIWVEKFPMLRAAIVALGILTDAQIDAILKEAEVAA